MKGSGRTDTLNLDADARPGDPTAVSDPSCWIAGQLKDALWMAFSEKLRMFRGAPTYREPDFGVFDVSDDVEITPDGILQCKSKSR